jgi:hypothetical protein
MSMYDELESKETELAVACFKSLHLHLSNIKMIDFQAEIRTGHQ